MNMRFLLSLLTFVISAGSYLHAAEIGQTYLPNARIAQGKAIKGQCLTPRDFPASDKNRQLAYKLLQRSGHAKPEIVILSNNPKYSTCAGLLKFQELTKAPVNYDLPVVTINIDEREQAELERNGETKWFAHGSFVCSLGHEIGHLMFRHYRTKLVKGDHAGCQQKEIEADLHGVQVSHCYQCAYNFIENWLYDSKHSPREREELRETPYADMTIKGLLAMSKKELETHIEATSKISRNPALKRSHPLHIERALRICYHIHFVKPMDPRHVCSYHKKQLPEKLSRHRPVSKAEQCMYEHVQKDVKEKHAQADKENLKKKIAELVEHINKELNLRIALPAGERPERAKLLIIRELNRHFAGKRTFDESAAFERIKVLIEREKQRNAAGAGAPRVEHVERKERAAQQQIQADEKLAQELADEELARQLQRELNVA